ncbi:hypothetical protein [Ulvibacterium marinum]|uniref:DUF3278 domain-containing protein n=1 Tax=Ulvibacterium marinum TaxID=2419782 RepID=A0A3B0C999_9FLAO|nr:hypothetical protein [Ulvibacterium marinum]RKN81108.1 hypothetical protein D7Z94_09190 [Ulvibacterium marinum]
MELEEIMTVWKQMSHQLEKQEKLTKEIILQMTQQRYSTIFSKVFTIESMAAIISYVIAFVLIFNLYKLDTWYLMTCGILTLVALFTLPLLVLRSLGRIRDFDIGNRNYKETLIEYIKLKKKLLLLQQFISYTSFVLMFTSLAAISKIISGKDFFLMEKAGWLYALIVIVLVFLFFFVRWGYKGYLKITASAEKVLLELEEGEET